MDAAFLRTELKTCAMMTVPLYGSARLLAMCEQGTIGSFEVRGVSV